jgi:hypothetical protein
MRILMSSARLGSCRWVLSDNVRINRLERTSADLILFFRLLEAESSLVRRNCCELPQAACTWLVRRWYPRPPHNLNEPSLVIFNSFRCFIATLIGLTQLVWMTTEQHTDVMKKWLLA